MLAPAVHPAIGVRRVPRLLVPSLSDCLFLAFLLWVFATGSGWSVLLADGDTGWHIRTGQYILDTRSVPTQDLFSFSKAGQPWFAWEWLSPRTVFFGVPVPHHFRYSGTGKKLLVKYEREMLAAAVAAVLWLAIAPTTGTLVAAPIILTLACFVGIARAHRRVVPYRVTQESDIREAEMQQDSELPWAGILTVLPFALLASIAAYIRIRWNDIPEHFPVHWTLTGTADGFVHRTPLGVYGILIFGAGLALLVLALALAIYSTTRRSPGRRFLLTFGIALAWQIAIVSSAASLRPLVSIPAWAFAAFTMAFILGCLATAVARAQTIPAQAAASRADCWRAETFYFNPDDPALFVQKEPGSAFSPNLARPLSWVILALFVVGIVGLVWFARSIG